MLTEIAKESVELLHLMVGFVWLVCFFLLNTHTKCSKRGKRTILLSILLLEIFLKLSSRIMST